jgi:hypothetical protein
MILNTDLALYISEVCAAIATGKLPADVVTNQCPECEEWLGYFDTGDHIVYDVSTDNDPEHMVVIVGCEGYPCIDPKLVNLGHIFPNWMPPVMLVFD